MSFRSRLLARACLLACLTDATPAAAQTRAPHLDSLLIETPLAPVEGALTLDRALELTARRSPSLRGAAWRVRAAEWRGIDAGKMPNPALAFDVENLGLDPRRREITLVAEQTLERGGKAGARRSTAEALAAVARAELSAEERRALESTVERFLDAWSEQEHAKQLARAERLAARSVEAARERFRAGAGPDVERVRAEALQALRHAEWLRARSDSIAALGRLVTQWGESGVSFDSLALEEPQPVHIPNVERAYARLEQHPERLRAAAEIAAESARGREARASRTSDVTLRAGAKRVEDPVATGVVAGFSIPLPLWNRPHGAGAVAEAERGAATARERQVALELRAELDAATQRYAAATESYDVLRTRVRPNSAEAVQQLAQGYRSGRFGSLELLDAQKTALEAEVALIDAAAEAWRARLQLERLLGEPLEQLETPGGER